MTSGFAGFGSERIFHTVENGSCTHGIQGQAHEKEQ